MFIYEKNIFCIKINFIYVYCVVLYTYVHVYRDKNVCIYVCVRG